MDDELFRLCRSVYEATAWESDELHWMIDTGSPVPFVSLSPGKKQVVEETDYPIYTSDYLLEKLPATVKNGFDGGDDYIIVYKKGKSWYADYMGQFKRQKSDTPLKALLKLTLNLHEEGLI